VGFSFFYTAGGASTIRGYQMAQYLGAKSNPKTGYEDDICVYVKKIYTKTYPKHAYLDILDAPEAITYAKNHPDLGIIADTQIAQKYIAGVLGRQDIVLIPHHHCNYERFVRPDREVKTVGIIGSKKAFQYPIEEIRTKLAALGLELLYDGDYWPLYDNKPNHLGKDGREKVVNFYKKVDIQIAWRLKAWSPSYEPLSRPLKLMNAGSFGIPTVAYPERSYVDEWDGCFLPAADIQELIYLVNGLRENHFFYQQIAKKTLRRAEDYHISKIAKLYQDLK
jgi:glycosyltransferase involved in cell wall biosynthesis